MKNHILAGKDKKTGAWHGLFYINHPTPSGCDRPILKYSTTQGFPTEKAAVEAMKAAFTPEQLAEMDVPEFSA